jgi:cytochrome d ubiquinol oxidase subunit II
MASVWFAIAALSLITYAVMDGFDLGSGALHLFVARRDAERRTVFAAIGPYWDGNEVWLIASGGVLFIAFPPVLASAFSGFYLALFFVLWSLVLRGISIEFRSHVGDPLWRAFFDVLFSGSSALLAFFFGVVLGNLVRGVPLDETGQFSLSLFTTFSPRGAVGLLDWYTLSVGALSLVALSAHGATFLVHKTAGEVSTRSAALSRRLWPAAALLFVGVSAETLWLRPELFAALVHRPLALLFIAVGLGGGGALGYGLARDRQGLAFVGSCALLYGVLASAAAALYPVMLPSTVATSAGLTAFSAATSDYGLKTALVWWPVAFVLTVGYFGLAFRRHSDKVAVPS